MGPNEEAIDELLSSYLDEELGSEDVARVEQLLLDRPELADRLGAWRLQRLILRGKASKPRNDDLAISVLRRAHDAVSQPMDSGVAPWISRRHPESFVEPASRQRDRNHPLDDSPAVDLPRYLYQRPWLYGGFLVGCVAACLVLMLSLRVAESPSHPQSLIANAPSNSNTSTMVSPPTEPSRASKNGDAMPILAVESPSIEPHANNSQASLEVTSLAEKARTNPQVASSNDAKSPLLMRSSNPAALKSPGQPTPTASAIDSLVGSELQPTPEQLSRLESMSPTASGAYVLVVDMSLPKGQSDLGYLQQVLSRHDIPWANQLDIDETTKARLVESRMISEAMRDGVIPPQDISPDAMRVNPEMAAGESASLVFVKGRGARLDQALIELMQSVEQFPDFSFDLAYDPPVLPLVEQLRTIQEAALPKENQDAMASRANALRLPLNSKTSEPSFGFAAAPRRTPPMDVSLRRSGAFQIADGMNPVVYALLIVRQIKAAE